MVMNAWICFIQTSGSLGDQADGIGFPCPNINIPYHDLVGKGYFSLCFLHQIQNLFCTFSQDHSISYSYTSLGYVENIETYLTLPANALMTIQSTYTGQNIGAGRVDRVMTGAENTVITIENRFLAVGLVASQKYSSK